MAKINLMDLISEVTGSKPKTSKARRIRQTSAPVASARLKFVSGTSSKFWFVDVHGRTVEKNWGRLGSEGQISRTVYPSQAKAIAAAELEIAAKLRKGYIHARGQ